MIGMRTSGHRRSNETGSRATSGCIRVVNEDVIGLYDRVKVGTKVVALPIAEHRVSGAWVRSSSLLKKSQKVLAIRRQL